MAWTQRGEHEDEQGGQIDGSGASGGDFAGGFYEAAGLVGEQAGAGAARAGDADWGDCARAATEARKGMKKGNREEPFGRLRGKRAVFQDECGILVEPAEFL